MPQARSGEGRRQRRNPVPVRGAKEGAGTCEEGAAAALTLQLLDFVADGRSYGETMEAWRSTCPRMPIWEDAVRDGLVRIENGGAMKSSRIVLTTLGKAVLDRNRGPDLFECGTAGGLPRPTTMVTLRPGWSGS